ncbi:MAG: anti-sigma factor family protein [Gemmatimonadota bacterium]
MSEHELNCREAVRLLAAYIDGELEEAERGRVEKHLETCRDCFSRKEFERRLKEQLMALGQRPVESSFERRIRHMIRRFRDEPASGPTPDSA